MAWRPPAKWWGCQRSLRRARRNVRRRTETAAATAYTCTMNRSGLPSSRRGRRSVAGLLALVLSLPGTAAELPQENPKLDSKAQQRAPTAFADEKPKPVLDWGV